MNEDQSLEEQDKDEPLEEDKDQYWAELDEVAKEWFEKYNHSEVLKLFEDWLFINQNLQPSVTKYFDKILRLADFDYRAALSHPEPFLNELVIEAIMAYLRCLKRPVALSSDEKLSLISVIAQFDSDAEGLI